MKNKKTKKSSSSKFDISSSLTKTLTRNLLATFPHSFLAVNGKLMTTNQNRKHIFVIKMMFS